MANLQIETSRQGKVINSVEIPINVIKGFLKVFPNAFSDVNSMADLTQLREAIEKGEYSDPLIEVDMPEKNKRIRFSIV